MCATIVLQDAVFGMVLADAVFGMLIASARVAAPSEDPCSRAGSKFVSVFRTLLFHVHIFIVNTLNSSYLNDCM